MARYRRMLAARLYDTVARIADGYDPDAEDIQALREAIATLRGEAELLRFIESDARGPASTNPCLMEEPWEGLVWQTATQLGEESAWGGSSAAALEKLTFAFEQVSLGGRDRAQGLVPFVRRLSAIAEQSAA